MRVVSALADLELEIASIHRQKEQVVVETAAGTAIETRIELGPRDVAHLLKLILHRPSLWLYVLALPRLLRNAPARADRDLNNPWSGP